MAAAARHQRRRRRVGARSDGHAGRARCRIGEPARAAGAGEAGGGRGGGEGRAAFPGAAGQSWQRCAGQRRGGARARRLDRPGQARLGQQAEPAAGCAAGRRRGSGRGRAAQPRYPLGAGRHCAARQPGCAGAAGGGRGRRGVGAIRAVRRRPALAARPRGRVQTRQVGTEGRGGVPAWLHVQPLGEAALPYSKGRLQGCCWVGCLACPPPQPPLPAPPPASWTTGRLPT